MYEEQSVEREVAQKLESFLSEVSYYTEEDREEQGLEELDMFENARVESLVDGGYLTSEEGFTIDLPNGSRVMVTVQDVTR